MRLQSKKHSVIFESRIIIDLMSSSHSPIGVFDSGVGGLSVLRAMRALMPEEAVLYFGDQGHVPYGPRSMEQIQSFSEGITNFLLDHDSKLIVVACNTASAAALINSAMFSSLPCASGDPSAFARCEELFKAICAKLYRLGDRLPDDGRPVRR
jgi:hypothetical protein